MQGVRPRDALRAEPQRGPMWGLCPAQSNCGRLQGIKEAGVSGIILETWPEGAAPREGGEAGGRIRGVQQADPVS